MIPLVSIIIPTYNRATLLKRAINSVLKQTYYNYEIIIVDDASDENIYNVVTEYNSNKIKYFKSVKNLGAQGSRNIGINLSKGEYIGFLDSDDEYAPEKIEKQINVFQSCSYKIGVVYSNANVQYDNSGKSMVRRYEMNSNMYKRLLMFPDIDFITPLVRTECFKKIGFLDEDVPSYQEWDTFIRISKYYNFYHINESLAIYHIHDNDSISKSVRKDYAGYAYIVKKHKNEIMCNCGYGTLFIHNLNLIYRYLRINKNVYRLIKAIRYIKS